MCAAGCLTPRVSCFHAAGLAPEFAPGGTSDDTARQQLRDARAQADSALAAKDEWRELATAPAAVDKIAKASAKENELRRLIAKLTFALQEKDMQLDAQRLTNRALSTQLEKAERKAPNR